jgi:dTDP-4-amino-4,6-dideoxygalactose transaminase
VSVVSLRKQERYRIIYVGARVVVIDVDPDTGIRLEIDDIPLRVVGV